MEWLWIGLGILYIVLLFTLGWACLKKGHGFLFALGLLFPLLWLIGALSRPTAAVTAPGLPPGQGATWPNG